MQKNLVLIGMPGSGKTKLSLMLSEDLRLLAIDTDIMVETAAGKPIPEIFAQDGEQAFRDLETEAVRQAAALDGVVIATGGGVVLRPENMEALREHGIVFFRDRSLAAIAGEDHSGRPLVGSDTSRLQTLYAQRAPLYRKYAHHIVAHTDTLEEAEQLIANLYREEALLCRN